MRFLTLLLFMFLTTSAFAQSKRAYRLYNAKGKKVSYKKMLRKIGKADVVLFGELHNNAIAHWLQLEITKDLAEEHSMVLGAEMMETDNQEALTCTWLIVSITAGWIPWHDCGPTTKPTTHP